MANNIQYGLSASIWTENLKRAHKVAHALETGTVWVNCWLLVLFHKMKKYIIFFYYSLERSSCSIWWCQTFWYWKS